MSFELKWRSAAKLLAAISISLVGACSGTTLSDLSPPVLVAELSVQFCSSVYAIDGDGQGYIGGECENHPDDELTATRIVDPVTVAALRSRFESIVGTGMSTCTGLEPDSLYSFTSPEVQVSICVDEETPGRPVPAEALFDDVVAAIAE